jgi:protoporphyrin/coproporphyrin ferrochelatase
VKDGVLLLGFGEPEDAPPEEVATFLEQIFVANARLDPSSDPMVVRRRARAMAAERAPGLARDYQRVGGSPLNREMAGQARGLGAELARRGHDVVVRVGMQFTEPDIPGALVAAAEAGVERLVVLPVYPLAGPSTTMAALDAVRRALDEIDWTPTVHEITGWHAHPDYTELRADGVRDLCAREGLDLADPGTRLVLAAHGTPLRYLRDGSRYDTYVREHGRRLAAALDAEHYVLGFQNHDSRPGVEWTGPDLDQVIGGLDAARLVVVPVSFMQEQSETLVDLDLELKAAADARGQSFHRVPIPHDDPRFAGVLADLVTAALGRGAGEQGALSRCRCRPGARCLVQEATGTAGPGRSAR